MSKSYAEISGAELLRADTCSQKIIIREHNSQESRNLISDNQFWGDDSLESRLLYEYTDAGNEGWSVERNGWNDYDEDKTLHMGPAETTDWIHNKMFQHDKSSFTVIQGYAGCGKTVFIHSLLRKYGNGAVNPCKNVYVDYDSDSSEGGYLTSAIRNWVIEQIIDLLLKKDGIQVYKEFVSLMSMYGANNASFSDLLVLFRPGGQIDSIVQEMSENSSEPEKYDDIANKFRVQFICGTTALSGALKSLKMSTQLYNAESLVGIKQSHFNQRRNYRRDAENYSTTEVSFKEIVQTFERFPFVEGNQVTSSIVEKSANDYSVEKSREKIINALSNMLKRNTKLDRINPNDEIELWRRPIYFTTNAFSLVDDMGNDNIYNELSHQISQFGTPNARITNFCLTDEGYTFIDKIATHFEFYSVRYNGNDAVPLCNLTEVDDVDKIVDRVFKKVERCVKNQKWLISFYIRQYGNMTLDPNSQVLDPTSDCFGKDSPDFKKCLNQYLGEKFHPRTESNRPQMHIVRTIYDHIRYLNDFRDSIIFENVPNLQELNICILRWIGEYLQLYRTNLYDLLDETIGSFNNVYLDLKYLYWLIYSDTSSNHLPLDDSRKRNLSIFRTDNLYEGSTMKISKAELLNDPMLVRYRK